MKLAEILKAKNLDYGKCPAVNDKVIQQDNFSSLRTAWLGES